MKINSLEQNYTPTFKSPVLAYPEYASGYKESVFNATKADAFDNNIASALANKFAKAFRLLFTPEITASAKNIKEGIDLVFEDPQVGKTLNKLA